ncbi:protein of unknown function [Paraburkholderia dioscoreae]|uniref:Uncharacterized protein n=1 Tax=Paraburkholderia dioscoreae TaxID=2604047 RepID=A0A5Q4YWK1_9BURK|nr:protein of unknown function [Paraburkholderia dioscoreae]
MSLSSTQRARQRAIFRLTNRFCGPQCEFYPYSARTFCFPKTDLPLHRRGSAPSTFFLQRPRLCYR